MSEPLTRLRIFSYTAEDGGKFSPESLIKVGIGKGADIKLPFDLHVLTGLAPTAVEQRAGGTHTRGRRGLLVACHLHQRSKGEFSVVAGGRFNRA